MEETINEQAEVEIMKSNPLIAGMGYSLAKKSNNLNRIIKEF